jgi:hypothetical protein
MSLDGFVSLIREYKALVDGAPTSTAHRFLSACAALLPRIYAAGISLPDTQPDSENVVRTAESPTAALSTLLGRYDPYLEIFDPYVQEEPVHGVISDDLADIDLDVVNPLISFDAGHVNDAVWQWRFNVRGHCGDHIVDTMRAIHRLVHDHMPDDSVATPRMSNREDG